jgi:alpha/beta superfamily hydrolase
MAVKEIVLKGPAGRLEGRYFKAADKNAPVAVIFHPHPVHGGTMNNKVVYTMFHAFAEAGFTVLRFNFRGVGKSTGDYDKGIGELADAAAALDWLQLHHPEAKSCWIAGFSFGAWITMQLLMRRPEVSGFIAVSPPANLYDFTFLSPCPLQGLIIQGTKDKIVTEESVYDLYERLSKQRNADVDYCPINNAGHFFKEQLDELKAIITDYVVPRMDDEQVAKNKSAKRKAAPVALKEVI